MFALLGAKNFGFIEIYGVSARTREVEQVRTFFGPRGRLWVWWPTISILEVW